MAKYRLMERDSAGNRTGIHFFPGTARTLDGKAAVATKVIKPGEVLESDEPLDQLFRNKFEKLDE